MMIIDVLEMNEISKWDADNANDKFHITNTNIFQICFICTIFNLYPHNVLKFFFLTYPLYLV